MVPTDYAIPYSELSAALAADSPVSTSQAPEVPVLSAWMSRALTAILNQADRIDVGTKDGICTAEEIRTAADAGVLSGEDGQYAVARLLDSPSSMEYLSRTAGADANTPGLVLADWQAAAAEGSLMRHVVLEGNTITPFDESVMVEIKAVMSSYRAFMAAAEANA